MPKICIDPGHAGRRKDPGAVNPITGLQEADVNLAIAKLVVHYLAAVGYKVILTRTEAEQAETDDLGYRTNMSDQFGADVFVSIHCNAATPSATGTETWYWYVSQNGKRLAQCLQKQLTNSLETVDRGIKESMPGLSLYVLKYTAAVSALVEVAFISNAGDEKLLASSSGQDCAARAIARGITDYFAEVAHEIESELAQKVAENS